MLSGQSLVSLNSLPRCSKIIWETYMYSNFNKLRVYVLNILRAVKITLIPIWYIKAATELFERPNFIEEII